MSGDERDDHDHKRRRPLGPHPAVRETRTRRAPRSRRCWRRARTFRERYRGRVAELEAPELATALDAALERSTTASRGSRSYAGLRLTTNVNGEDERDLNAAVEIALVEIQNLLRFFELEWIAVDDEHAARVLAD